MPRLPTEMNSSIYKDQSLAIIPAFLLRQPIWLLKELRWNNFSKQYNITQIDILKIDIEGAETFLFSADAPWLEYVKHILIELHSDANVKQFENAVRHYDFRIEKRASKHENIYWAYKPSPLTFIRHGMSV